MLWDGGRGRSQAQRLGILLRRPSCRDTAVALCTYCSAFCHARWSLGHGCLGDQLQILTSTHACNSACTGRGGQEGQGGTEAEEG